MEKRGEWNTQLESRVAERTAELLAANAALQWQISRREQIDDGVRWLASFPEEHPNPIAEFERESGVLSYANPAAMAVFPELDRDGFRHPWLADLQEVARGWNGERSETVSCEVAVGQAAYALTVTYRADTQRIRVYGSDVTERKRIENQLRASLKEVGDLKAALDEHAIVATTDPQGRITSVNDKFCAISKYSREELLGQDHRIINSGYHPTEFIRDLWTTITHGRVWHGEIKNRAKDSSFYWVDTTIVPFLDEQGKPRQYVAIRADITERKRVEDAIRQLNAELEDRVGQRTGELEAANRELEAFSYSVSHDLRAPLRAIDGYSQAVLEDFAPQLPEDGRNYLRTIRQGAQQMGMLIDDLLTFSRLSRAPLNKRQVDTGDLVRGVLESLGSQREGRQIEFRMGALPACAGDPALLTQVWQNLLSNALKYSRRRAAAIVEIGCEPAPEGHVFFVRDNGTGFDMRYAAKLFGVFQRLHRAEEYEGTGVGLALVQRIIHRHGGRVWADAAVDQGAAFYFTLERKTPHE